MVVCKPSVNSRWYFKSADICQRNQWVFAWCEEMSARIFTNYLKGRDKSNLPKVNLFYKIYQIVHCWGHLFIVIMKMQRLCYQSNTLMQRNKQISTINSLHFLLIALNNRGWREPGNMTLQRDICNSPVQEKSNWPESGACWAETVQSKSRDRFPVHQLFSYC